MHNEKNETSFDSNWKKLKLGDKIAYENIYKSNVQTLFKYGMSLKNNENDVLDAIQDVFTDIWLKRERLSDTDNVKFYLLKSLKNRIFRNQNESNRLQVSDNINENNLHNIEAHQEIEHFEFQNFLHEKLEVCLTGLTDKQNEIIKLKYFENKSLKEISEQLGINLQSAKNLLFRTLTSIRDIASQ